MEFGRLWTSPGGAFPKNKRQAIVFFGILVAIYVKTPIYSKKLGLKYTILWNMGLYTEQIQAEFQKTGDRTVEFLELKK